MNASEFLAMLDIRLSDGVVYPTLDDYTAALAALNRPEPVAAPAPRFSDLADQVRYETRQRCDVLNGAADRVARDNLAAQSVHVYHQNLLMQNALARPAPLVDQIKRFRLEMRVRDTVHPGPWYDAAQSFDDLAQAERVGNRIHQVQPHVETRVVDSWAEKSIRPR